MLQDAGLTSESIASTTTTRFGVPSTRDTRCSRAEGQWSPAGIRVGAPASEQPAPPSESGQSWFSGGVHESSAGTAPVSATCAALSEALAEPLSGTAAVAQTWLCLEQRGPWGHTAPVQSHLDPELGRSLTERTEAAGVRLQLIRRPGKHPDTPGPQRAYLAHTVPGRSWLRAADLTDPAELLDLDFHRTACGSHDGWGEPVDEPLLLVCTNGRRDRCCAVKGRALIHELAGRHLDSVWESTHTGGHRFAPAAVLLPTGYTYGRLDGRGGEAALSAAASGKLVTDQCRGRSCWSHAGQAAELAVREAIGEYLSEALHVVGESAITSEDFQDKAGKHVIVTHTDGRQWQVTVRERKLDPPRPNSCGKTAAHPVALSAETVLALRPGH